MKYAQTAVGHVTPVEIVVAPNVYPGQGGDNGPTVCVNLNNNGHIVYLGDANVTALTGLPIASSASALVPLWLFASESLYAICGGTDSTVLSYLTSGVS